MTVEQQDATIRKSIDLLEACGGKKVTGWASPVVAFTPETAGLLAKAGLAWTTDVTYADLPIRICTPHGAIAGVPTTDFSDNRVMRASPRDLFEVYKGTFDYLHQNEPMGLMVLVIHCQFGGRPLITAVLQEILKYIGQFPDVWFARHEELARWALAALSTSTPMRAGSSATSVADLTFLPALLRVLGRNVKMQSHTS